MKRRFVAIIPLRNSTADRIASQWAKIKYIRRCSDSQKETKWNMSRSHEKVPGQHSHSLSRAREINKINSFAFNYVKTKLRRWQFSAVVDAACVGRLAVSVMAACLHSNRSLRNAGNQCLKRRSEIKIHCTNPMCRNVLRNQSFQYIVCCLAAYTIRSLCRFSSTGATDAGWIDKTIDMFKRQTRSTNNDLAILPIEFVDNKSSCRQTLTFFGLSSPLPSLPRARRFHSFSIVASAYSHSSEML